MKNKKILGTILMIILVLLIVLTSCRNLYPQYNYEGPLGNEKISSWEEVSGLTYIHIEVTKSDGNKLFYSGRASSKELVSLKIIFPNGRVDTYDNSMKDPVAIELMQEAAKRYKYYLEEIAKIKTSAFYR